MQPSGPDLALLLNILSTWFMIGAIWIVQRVHYPLFDHVEEARYVAFARQHTRRISWIVMPAMLCELATALLLVLSPPAAIPAWSTWLGLALLAVIWLSTFLGQVPCHRRLATGFDTATHRRLVAGNWLRTAGWSLRGLLTAGWLLAGGS